MRAEAAQIRRWRDRPDDMVRDLFKIEPDIWQREVLQAFPHNQRIAMKACKGPGKTTTLAWLAWNFLLTRPRPKIAATSITAANLADGLWTEMAKWLAKSELLKSMFVWTKTRIYAKEAEAEWWMSARAWAKGASTEQQADTLAGLHADYLLFILDEAGGIPDAVMAAAEAGLASGIESHILMAGNPTHLSGPLYRATTRERHLWKLIEITGDPDDPRRSPRVSAIWARQQIEKYGIDNPWVLINVFGRFPPSSLNALLGPDDVSAAVARRLDRAAYDHAARILGVDVARFGDDKSVIAFRQGLFTKPFLTMRNKTSNEIASRVSVEYDTWEADSIQVDATGGYGWGVIDALTTMNRRSVAVEFSGEASTPGFLNKRAEIWWAMAQWVKGGGMLPDDPELAGELTEVTYWHKGDEIQIEAKDQIKERIGRSPDLADALALTFASPVMPRTIKTGSSGSDRYRRPVRHSAGGWAA